MTANVIAESTVAQQIEDAWKAREGLLALDSNPTFRRIVEELSDQMHQRVRKASTRGYPRYAFAL